MEKPAFETGETVDVICKCGCTKHENCIVLKVTPVSPKQILLMQLLTGKSFAFAYDCTKAGRGNPEPWLRRPFGKMLDRLNEEKPKAKPRRIVLSTPTVDA